MRNARTTLHMLTAVIWATRSTCKRAKVGAVVTSLDYKRQIGVGYNGPQVDLPNDSCTEVSGNCGCLHAENNVLDRMQPPYGMCQFAMFTTTMPCFGCAQKMVKHGVKVLWYLNDYRNLEGINLLDKENVVVYRTNREELRDYGVDLLHSILRPQD